MLFADLAGSLAFLESLDPEEARRLLVGVVELMITAVRGSGGIVNQAMGDGVMAIFGAPVADEHHALNACIAAVRIHEAVGRHAHFIKPQPAAEIRIRVGIHSGEVVVGERGEGFDFQYSAFGKTTHVAARLEQMARPGTSWMTASTYALVLGQVRVEPMGDVLIRGLSQTVAVFELSGVRLARQKQRSGLGYTPLIGRSDEREVLRECLRKASSGSGGAVILSGEPGVGKSRLTAEGLAEASQKGWLVLESGAAHYFRHSTYFVVRDALRSYFLLNEDDDIPLRHRTIAQQLSGHQPPVAVEAALLSLFGVDTPTWDAISGPARQRQIIDALVWLTLAESRRQPVVWVIEDLQWADAATEAFLSRLIDVINVERVLVLVNHRPEHRPSFADLGHCITLPVKRLADQALRHLLDEILGSSLSLEPLKETLATRTGGNPFFIEECVRALLECGNLSGDLGDYRWTGAMSEFIPNSIQDVLSARIDRLRPEQKDLLQSASVVGLRVDPSVLQRLTRLADAEFESRMTALCMHGFMIRSLHVSELSYQFVHVLSHDVAYHSLLLETRRHLHARVVDVLETEVGERVSDQADILAHHAFAGQQWAKATQYYRAAGRSALSQFACEVAVAHTRAALKALDHLSDDRNRREASCDVRLELRNALFPLARHSDILACLTEAETLASSLDDVLRQARVAAHLCHCHWLIGDWRNAVAAGHRALELAGPTDDAALLVWARFFKALAHCSLGEFDAAIDLLENNAATLVGDMRCSRFGGFSLPFVVGADWLGYCLSERGEFAAAFEHTESGLSVAENVGFPFDRMHGLLGVAGVHLMRGTVADAVPLLEHALALLESTPVVSVRPRVLALLACAYSLSDRIPAALVLAERATREAGGHGALRTLCLRWSAEVFLAAGRAEEALRAAQDVLDAARAPGQRGLVAWTLRLIGDAQAVQGDFAAARVSLEEALAIAQSLHMRPLVAHCHRALASVALGLGYRECAQRKSDAAQEMYLALGMPALPEPAVEASCSDFR